MKFTEGTPAFSDEALKRLKKYIESYPSSFNHSLNAVIARLEAAEDYIGALTTGAGIKTRHLFLEAWRRAKGEGE